MATPPQLNEEQRAAALVKAAAARTARAELKNKLKMGMITLRGAIDGAETDETIGKLKVITLLESLPGMGKVKARRLMDEIGIADSRRMKGLGPQQRLALLERLPNK